MGKILTFLAAAALVLNSASARSQTTDCSKAPTSRAFGGIQSWRVDDAIGFATPGLQVDADGAPNSYLVDGKGLSQTCDGMVAIVNGKAVTPDSDRNHWYSICVKAWADAQATNDFRHVSIFGFLTGEQNRPIVQAAGDPLPGQAYISTTSLTVPETPDRTQRHWVDAVVIPYVVLPPKFAKAFNVALGDLAVVYRPKNNSLAFAVYADSGPALGEASVKLHRDLKNEPVVKKNGVERAKAGIGDRIITLVFPGNNVPGSPDSAEWTKRIQEAGTKALTQWGGIARLHACAESPAH